jgi:hypothetical protein
MTTKIAKRVADKWLGRQVRTAMTKQAKGMKVPRIDSYLARIFKDRLGVTDPRMAQFLWGMFVRAGEIATEHIRYGFQEEAAEQRYTLDGKETKTVKGRNGAEYVDQAHEAEVTYTNSITVGFTPERATGREIKREFLRLARTLLKKNGLDENEVWALWTKYVASDVADALTLTYEEHEVRDEDNLEGIMDEYGEGEFDAEAEVHRPGSRDGGDTIFVNAYGDDISSWYVSYGYVRLEYEATASGDLMQTGYCQVEGSPRFNANWDY